MLNPTLAVFLTNPGAAMAISVAYDKTEQYGKTLAKDVKTFKIWKHMNVQKHDLVVIPTDTRWGFTVGRVEELDVRINFASQEQMRWVLSIVDKPLYDRLLKEEDTLMARVAQAEEEDARKELARKLQALGPDMSGLNLLTGGESVAPLRAGGTEPASRGGAQSGNDYVQPYEHSNEEPV